MNRDEEQVRECIRWQQGAEKKRHRRPRIWKNRDEVQFKEIVREYIRW